MNIKQIICGFKGHEINVLEGRDYSDGRKLMRVYAVKLCCKKCKFETKWLNVGARFNEDKGN